MAPHLARTPANVFPYTRRTTATALWHSPVLLASLTITNVPTSPTARVENYIEKHVCFVQILAFSKKLHY